MTPRGVTRGARGCGRFLTKRINPYPIPRLPNNVQGTDEILSRRGGTRSSSALRLLRPGPSRPHAHSVRACGRPVGQRLPFDARAVCLPPVAAVAPVSAPSGDDACCSATALHGSGLSSGAAMAAATSAGVMRAHFGARYTWPRRCCAGCRTAAADHLLLETMGCAAVGRSFVMSSNSTEAWDAQECVVIELQHHPCRPFHPHPVARSSDSLSAKLYTSAAAGTRVSRTVIGLPAFTRSHAWQKIRMLTKVELPSRL